MAVKEEKTGTFSNMPDGSDKFREVARFALIVSVCLTSVTLILEKVPVFSSFTAI